MKKAVLCIFSLIIIIIIGILVFYNINIGSVGKNEEVIFEVDSGSNYNSIIKKLKQENLIKNELCFKIYIKLNSINTLQAGKYKLNKNMTVEEITEVFNKGNSYNPDAITITFKEGKNIKSIASVIEENTTNTKEDVYSLLKDNAYLNEIINDYWFIDNSILNSNIYYSLEGYLYPNTYEFKNKNVTVKEIFKVMLDEMDKKLSKYKDDILKSKYSFHEILTLASIVELEGKKVEDRNSIAQVFYNRLNLGMALGSDVTTYYGSGVDMSERDLYANELNDPNAYNTRSNNLEGKLPVGPICNPSIDSIISTLYPDENDYIYFVADKNGKVYFTKTYNEHIQKRDELIKAGLWYTYE